mmetsp:Transcript_25554/g.56338  ORF Transcript_25554/g.56338 Transcript_25554/m.56338 type:complete len:385 (-) Transcript_25554:117-1271(-)
MAQGFSRGRVGRPVRTKGFSWRNAALLVTLTLLLVTLSERFRQTWTSSSFAQGPWRRLHASSGRLDAFSASGCSAKVRAFPWWNSKGRGLVVLRRADSEDSEDGFSLGAPLLLPVGPFCPYKSNTISNQMLDNEMETISVRASGMASRLAPIMLDAQMGKAPDPKLVGPLAQEMTETADLWGIALTRLQMAEDFQALETFKLTEAEIARKGMTIRQVQDCMKWQTEGMVAFCEGRPPPPMPSSLPEEVLAGAPPNLGDMFRAGGGILRVGPFLPDSKALQSEVVQEELTRLSSDHAQLIKMGETYRSFDPAGKLAFLDQIEEVASRWEVFLTRFQLMGELNPEYVREAEEYLKRVNLSPLEFRKLLKEAHDIMRADAEREANSR